MSLRKCPDCENFHRGRCLVCRPCARQRLIDRVVTEFVSHETVTPTHTERGDHETLSP
jgi:hypothetical protein